jgi:hypothetical protein
VFDVYIDIPPKNKVWLVDINMWHKIYTDSLLFEWEEIEKSEELEFRVIENAEMIVS